MGEMVGERKVLLASELYALTKSAMCKGDQECHWCGAPCEQVWLHDDEPIVAGIKNRWYARRPGNPHVCVGCWIWRYRSVTVQSLGGEQKDGQTARKQSWWITPEGAWVIRDDDHERLRKLVLAPPEVFCLALLDRCENHLPLMIVNNRSSLKADDALFFTVDGTKEQYSIYQLENALATHEVTGKDFGVRYLIEKFKFPFGEREKRGPGRPAVDSKKDPSRTVRGKGNEIEVTAWEDGEEESIEDIFPRKSTV